MGRGKGDVILQIKRRARAQIPGNWAMEGVNEMAFQSDSYFGSLIKNIYKNKLQLLCSTQHFKSSHGFQAYPAKHKLWFIWNLLINTGMALSPAVAQLLARENFFFLKKKENIFSWNSKVPLQKWSLPRQNRKGVKCGGFSLCFHWVLLSCVAQADSLVRWWPKIALQEMLAPLSSPSLSTKSWGRVNHHLYSIYCSRRNDFAFFLSGN